MGAFEFPCGGDRAIPPNHVVSDGNVSVQDFLPLLSYWGPCP